MSAQVDAMSDADRLREAADRLDEWAANAERSSLPRVAARTRAQARSSGSDDE